MANKIERILLYTFSAFLSLGIFNPFNPTAILEEDTTGFTPVQIISVLFVFVALVRKKNYVKYWVSTLPLFVLFLLLLVSGLLYDYTMYANKLVFNYKFIISILFYLLIAIYFARDTKLRFWCLVIFALGSTMVSSLYISGVLEPFALMSKGRLFLFGENPNSSSTRMAISGLIWLYIILENPAQWSKIRYLFLFGVFVLLWFVLVSGSRGSLVALVLSAVFMFFRARISLKIKVFTLLFFIPSLYFIYDLVANDMELSIIDRMDSMLERGETGSRTKIWETVLEIINDNILIGVGENGYIDEMTTRFGHYIDPHNMFLYVFACGGILALITLLVFIGKLMLDIYKILSYSAFPFALFLLVLFVAVKTGGVLTYIVMWYFFGVAKSYCLEKKITNLA